MPTALRQHIGVALSGGGHRASLFGLGALLYLIDAGKGPELANVASVSGGSLTNGFVGTTCDLTTVTHEDFAKHAQKFAHAIARGGTLWAAPLTFAFLLALPIPVIAAVGVTRRASPLTATVAWVVAALLVGLFAKQRSIVTAMAFDRALFHGKKLTDLHSAVDHVVCATDLQTARSAYFSGRFVHSYATGWGKPGGLRLSWAVGASACVPGLFSPVVLPTKRHQFGTNVLRHFLLVDGGVYDNMGTEWISRLGGRITDGTPPEPKPVVADQVVVVNASAGQGDRVSSQLLVRLPLIGEVMSLVASNGVLYNQSTAVRRRWMDLRFRGTRAGFDGPDGALDGVMVQIDRLPTDWPSKFAGNDPIGRRALACQELLATDATDWAKEAAANAAVKTKLSKIEVPRAASLIRHAYVLTMVNAHIVSEDYPLLPLPDDAHLQKWIG